MSLSGTVKSYNGLKGFGFICGEDGSGDLFFAKRDLAPDASDVQGKFLQGRLVAYDAAEQPDGKQKATSVMIVPVEGQPVPGVVKSYSEKNGYGFITSSVLVEDIRFQQRDIPDSAPGGAIAQGCKMLFDVQARPDGKLMARNLKFQNMECALAAPMAMKGCGKGGKGGKGMMSPGMMGGGAGPEDTFDAGEMEGVVKFFSEQKGYGFIVVEGQTSDVKFGSRDLGGLGSLPQGTPVTFQGQIFQDGRVQAKDVVPSQGGTKRFAEPSEGEPSWEDDGSGGGAYAGGAYSNPAGLIRPTSAKKHQADFQWGF